MVTKRCFMLRCAGGSSPGVRVYVMRLGIGCSCPAAFTLLPSCPSSCILAILWSFCAWFLLSCCFNVVLLQLSCCCILVMLFWRFIVLYSGVITSLCCHHFTVCILLS